MCASHASRTGRLADAISACLLSLQLGFPSAGWGVDSLFQPTRSEHGSDRQLGGREACTRWLRSFEMRNRMSPSRRAEALRRCSGGSFAIDENPWRQRE